MPEQDKTKSPDADKPREETKPPPQDNLITTRHTITVNGQPLDYSVTTGTLVLKEEVEKEGAVEGEKPKATLFFIAYTRENVSDPSARPITFSFNGGPGSASVWLHMGVLGPRRVVMTDLGDLPPPPYRLADNEYSLLDVTDLVFIDPVGTGYSRPVSGEKVQEFHTFKRDIESVGDFIRLYTTRYGRWLSPKFLIGESYGTTRAAGLSGYLQERHGLYLNGIMLVSAVLDFATLLFNVGNDLPYILFLPTYTATAWYHKRLDPELQEDLPRTLQEVEQFALGDYASALLKGDALTAEERNAVAQKLARFTGLSVEYLQRTHLRIRDDRFTKELLRSQGRTVGRLDSRFTGIDRDTVGEVNEYDPSYTNIAGPYAAAFNDYVKRELKFESDLPYEILSFKVNQAWRFGEHENQYVYVAETLRKAMTINPHLKVFVANGYFDLATPYFAAEYTWQHLAVEAGLRKNLSAAFYPAGHMMYIHLPSLAQLRQDLQNFIVAALAAA